LYRRSLSFRAVFRSYSIECDPALPVTKLSRRTVLTSAAGTGPLALTGCLDGSFANTGNGQALSYELDLQRIGESLVPRALWQPDDSDRPHAEARNAAVRAAAAGERPTTYGYEPIPSDEYVEHEGTYYKLDVVATGLERIERPVLTLSWVGHVDDLEDPPVHVSRDDLPPIDRSAIMPAYVAARAREHDGGAPWDVVEEGGTVYRHLDAGTSELAPTPEHDHVRVHDTILAVTVERRTLAEPAYTGVRIPVAESRAAFERALDGELVDARIDASELSAQARRIITSQRHEEETPLSPAFRSVIEALERRELLPRSVQDPPEATNGRHLAYDEAYYRYGLYVNTAT
jgi:hypothetical protein